MKALIINFNRLELPMRMANYLVTRGVEPIIIDNHSDYKPLLDYYKTRCPFKVVRMNNNYGHIVVWSQGVLKQLGITGQYIVTDPDLDLSGIPDDFLSVLEEGLRKYPQFSKCGFSLEINDVKNQCTIDWESTYWQFPLDAKYYNAIIDTTFALYRNDQFSYSGIRTNRPYTARHVPWYYDKVKDLPADEQYYFNTQKASYAEHSNVTGREKVK